MASRSRSRSRDRDDRVDRDRQDDAPRARSAREQLRDEAACLPVAGARDELMRLLREHDIVVCVGETGSGKTTQIPQFLADAALAPVAVTQPRRVAAVSVARRVAHERGVELGGEVGYRIRFDDCTARGRRAAGARRGGRGIAQSDAVPNDGKASQSSRFEEVRRIKPVWGRT